MLVLLQVAEDKTFGLKNKNKSAKVQQYASDLLLAHRHHRLASLLALLRVQATAQLQFAGMCSM